MKLSRSALVATSAGMLLTSGVALSTQASAATPYFASCAQAAAHGYTNMPKGSPGYRPGLDEDHDGIACESATPASPKAAATKAATPATPQQMPQKPAAGTQGPKIQTDLVTSSHDAGTSPLAIGGLAVGAAAGMLLVRRRTN